MIESNIIVLKSANNKIPGQEYKFNPVPNKNGLYPSCIRKVNKDGDMILTEKDKQLMNEGKAAFIPEDAVIVVKHGTSFDLDDVNQLARWEAIKNSKLIAPDRAARDEKGVLMIDGAAPTPDRFRNPKGRYGLAELYVDHPGLNSQIKVSLAKKIHEAQDLIFKDSLAHQVLICKLFEKDMSHAHPNDVEAYLLDQASKSPDKVIKYYNAEESAVRLLLLTAIDRGVVTRKAEGLYYADIKLGSNIDIATSFLKADENKILKQEMKNETYPELEKKGAVKK